MASVRRIAACGIVVFLSCAAPLAYASGRSQFGELLNPDEMQRIWGALVMLSPVFLALQFIALLVLIWRVVYRWRPELLGTWWLQRWLLQASIVVAPVLMLILSAAMEGGYQGERGGHWFFHIHSGFAGLVFVPVYVLGSISVSYAIAKPGFRLSSFSNLVVLWTLCAVCAWYAFATAFLDMGNDRAWDLSFMWFVPAIAAVNYALLAVDAIRHHRTRRGSVLALIVWFSAVAASLAAKVPLAKNIYAALPPERPAGYGDCFVVSAATGGHPAFVGSHFDAELGRIVNRQWQTLHAFEDRLAARRPALHRRIRRLYNRVGPAVAAQIHSPLAADITYTLLKPAEWLATAYLRYTDWRQVR